MKKDITIEHIRAVRQQISAEFNHDPRRLVAHYRQMEKKYKGRMLKNNLVKSSTADAATMANSKIKMQSSKV